MVYKNIEITSFIGLYIINLIILWKMISNKISNKIKPTSSFNIKYYKLDIQSTYTCIRYDSIVVKYRLDVITSLLESINNIVSTIIDKINISGVHNIVYSHLLYTSNSELRYVNGFYVREFGLIQFQNIVTMWYNFLSNNLDGFYLDSDCVVQIERICETNINRLNMTIKEYDRYVSVLWFEQKKVNKYRLMRWIQKYTIGKGYTPSFIKISIDKLPIIKYKWDYL